ncbi:hypothetical protein ASJ81_07820 [Methanosarcina spelaei]|uniref:Uncharacterized protein n=1 Tax=Methanosarcina spelaei TaxID=1036679 RepID=A0A2A2HRM9_9EURY|nr:hypothetical protein ASJ81_07820 [Methanosarcina spelaei]
MPFSLRYASLKRAELWARETDFQLVQRAYLPKFLLGSPSGRGPNFFLKMLARKLFQKKLKRKPLARFGFGNLIPKPYRRDKPAQRFRVNSFEQKLLVKFI